MLCRSIMMKKSGNTRGINMKIKRVSMQLLITASILFVFFILFVINVTFHYNNNAKVYYNELKNQNDMLVKQFATNKELLIRGLNSYTYNLAFDDVQFRNLLENFQNTPEDKIKLLQKLQGFVNSNKFMTSAYVFITKEELIFSTDMDMSYRKGDFYDTYPFDAINEKSMIILDQRQVKILNKNSDYISIVCKVNDDNNKTVGMLVANVNSSGIYKEAQNSITMYEKFNIYAVNSKGNVLYCSDPKLINSSISRDEIKPEYEKVKLSSNFDKGGLISEYYSTSEKMYYILDLKLRNYESKNIFQYALFTFLITCTLALILKITMSQKILKPLNRVVNHITDSYSIVENDESEINFIESAFNDLAGKNSQLKKQYTEMFPIYRENLLRDLVINRGYTLEEIRNKTIYYDINIDLNNCILLALRIKKSSSEEEKNQMERILVKNKIESMIVSCYKGFCVETGKNDMGICLNIGKAEFDDIDYNSIVNFAENIAGSIKEELNINVNIGIGSFVGSIEDACKSYEEALESLNYIKVMRKAVGSIYEVKKYNKNIFEYPYEFESKLMNFIRLGEHEQSYFYLDKFFEDMKSQNNLTDDEVQFLLYLLLGSLSRLIYENHVEILNDNTDIAKKFYKIRNSGIDEAKDELKAYITNIIDKINENKSNSNSCIKNILQYIDQGFTSELQLIDLEEKFSLNKYYIGQLIKEHTGINFNDYINKKRIEKSIELLKNTELSIKDISGTVGYSYPHYFIKVFKKINGVAPGEFRNKALL